MTVLYLRKDNKKTWTKTSSTFIKASPNAQPPIYEYSPRISVNINLYEVVSKNLAIFDEPKKVNAYLSICLKTVYIGIVF